MRFFRYFDRKRMNVMDSMMRNRQKMWPNMRMKLLSTNIADILGRVLVSLFSWV